MSRNSLGITGVAELMDALRKLPRELVDQGDAIVVGHADNAAEAIREGYPDGPSGALKNGVSVTSTKSTGGTVATVKSSNALASIFENGTAVRHTELGYDRGRMPPGKVFVPIVVQARRDMYEELVELVQGKGLEVSGEPD